MLAKITKIAFRELLWLLAALIAAFGLSFLLYKLIIGSEQQRIYLPILHELGSEKFLKIGLYVLCFVGFYVSRVTWVALRTIYDT